jgi:hypothetical protein
MTIMLDVSKDDCNDRRNCFADDTADTSYDDGADMAVRKLRKGDLAGQ